MQGNAQMQVSRSPDGDMLRPEIAGTDWFPYILINFFLYHFLRNKWSTPILYCTLYKLQTTCLCVKYFVKNLHRAETIYTGGARGARDKYQV